VPKAQYFNNRRIYPTATTMTHLLAQVQRSVTCAKGKNGTSWKTCAKKCYLRPAGTALY